MHKIIPLFFVALFLMVYADPADAVSVSEQERLARMDRAMDCFEAKDTGGEIDWQDVCLLSGDGLVDDQKKEDEISRALNRVENRRQIFEVDNKVSIPKPYGAQFDLGMEVSHIKYEEPNVAVKHEGIMYGVRASYNLRPKPEDDVLSSLFDVYHLDGHADYAKMEYEGSGTAKDISDYLLETRFWVGKDFRYGEFDRLTPYMGIGHRFLFDDGSKVVTSTGAIGYDRRSNYIYLPIGLEGKCQAGAGWQMGFTAEYDYLVRGWQESFLSDVDSGAPDIKNTQKKGFGTRGSLSLIKQGDKYDLVFGPYIRYWHIDDSDTVRATGPVYVVTGLEPENESTELGGQMGVRF